MLSEQEVRSIFERELPGVEIVNVDRISYIESSVRHPFIQQQIKLGIYSETNIYTEFLSYARAFVPSNRLEFCYDLLLLHGQNAPDDVVRAYVNAIAHHEAEHFASSFRPQSWQEHALAEADCNGHDDDEKAEDDWATYSPIVQRVFARISHIGKSLK